MLKKRPINFKNKKILALLAIIFIIFISYLLSRDLVNSFEITKDLPIKIFKLSFRLKSKIILIVVFTITYFGFITLICRVILILTNKIIDRFTVKKYPLKEENFYSQLLYKYSPGVLSYIYNLNLTNQAITGTIIYLEVKRFISIKEDRYRIIRNNTMGLLQNEKLVFNNIKNKNIKRIDYSAYKEKIIEDSLKHKLIEQHFGFISKINAILLLFTPIILTLVISPVAMVKKINFLSYKTDQLFNYLLVNIFGAILLFVPIIIITSLLYYWHMKNDSNYRLTNEGKEIVQELKGLRIYLMNKKNEFSIEEGNIFKMILNIKNKLSKQYKKIE